MILNSDFPRIHLADGYGEDDLTQAEIKGYLPEVKIELQENVFLDAFFIDLVRLTQEFERDQRRGIPCFYERGLIVLESITKANIMLAVDHLFRKKELKRD